MAQGRTRSRSSTMGIALEVVLLCSAVWLLWYLTTAQVTSVTAVANQLPLEKEDDVAIAREAEGRSRNPESGSTAQTVSRSVAVLTGHAIGKFSDEGKLGSVPSDITMETEVKPVHVLAWEALHGADTFTRTEAILALHNRDSLELASISVELAHDPIADVRYQALWTLWRLAARDIVDRETASTVFEQSLQDEAPTVSDLSAAALADLTGLASNDTLSPHSSEASTDPDYTAAGWIERGTNAPFVPGDVSIEGP